MQYRALQPEELRVELFNSFDRFQQVNRCWRKDADGWTLKECIFTEQWTLEEYALLVECLRHTLETGGGVFGAFEDGRLKGFASVEAPPLGSRGQYRQLSSLHVSHDLRGRGIGRRLFQLACGKARELGGERLYISSHSAEETQAFYKTMGCREAEEYEPRLSAAEPFDCQLEKDLSDR